MVVNFTKNPPRNVRETINWLIQLGRPPLPESPVEAAKQGKEPKQPCFLDGKYLKSVNWKQWQNTQPLAEIYNYWFKNPKTGIGTLGGWNGKHWLGWIDFDQKNFTSAEECDHTIVNWVEKYPMMQMAPMFRTPSGGYRFLVAFNCEPENFKATSGFSLNSDGSHHVGELLSKNGGHTLLPPTIGISGKSYEWVQWSEYPPAVNQPEDVGLYPVRKKTQPQQQTVKPDDLIGNNSLSDLLNQEIYPRLTLDCAFNWHGHEFKQYGKKLKGNCPWHNSQSGTAFYAEVKNGSPVWRCPACEIGGGVIEYRHRLTGGNGSPRGTEFVALVKELASEAGVFVPELGNSSGNPRTGGSGGNGGDGGDYHSGKVVKHPKFFPLADNELEARIDQLIAQNLKSSKLTSQLNRLADESGRHVSEVRKQYNERKGEVEQTDEEVEAKLALPNLLVTHRLNLSNYLWGDGGLLAQVIVETAKAMPTSPEFLFTTLLPTAATLIGTSSRVVVKPKAKYKQPCVFWSAVVARSGQLKTPAQKVILDPLVQLEIEENQKYQEALEDYEMVLASWKKDKNPDPADKPKPPIRKRYLTKDATIETLERIHGQNPRGVLVHRDEVAEDFKSDNAYRNGKGGDKEKKLDQFNGSPLIIDRKDREVALERSAISRTGSIQWEVLQSLMGDGHDINGTFARWLFCATECPPRLINLLEDDIDTGIDKLLTDLYKRLEKIPEADYLLSLEAKKLFQQWQHELVYRELEETHPGLQVVYPKIEAYTARFALWLHIVNAALAEQTPELVISEHTMSAAVQLGRYYLSQFELVLATNSPQSGLTGVLLKIINYLKGKKAIKISQLKSSIRALRQIDKTEIRSYCQWLGEHGYAVITDDLIQHKDSKVYDTNDNLMTRQSNAQTTSLKGFDKVCDIYDVYDTTTQTASNVVDTFNPSVERVINVITSQEVTEDLSEQGVDVYDASIINDVINDDGCHTEDATNSTHETEAREPLKDGEKAKLRTPKPQVIRPGQRVKIKLKGSSRDGMTGVVREQKADVQGNVIVRLDDSPQLRQLMAKNPNSNLHCIEVSLSQLETMR